MTQFPGLQCLVPHEDVTLDPAAIAARTLKAYWFDPTSGTRAAFAAPFMNAGNLALEKRSQVGDRVVVIEAVR